MPQISVWPFMGRTMVDDAHGVKPLFRDAESPWPRGRIDFGSRRLTQP
jgi:hypothetical protein